MMLFLTKVIILLAFVSTYFKFSCTVCDVPVEVGFPYSVNYFFQNKDITSVKFLVYLGNGYVEISKCDTNGSCSYKGSIYKQILTYDPSSNLYTSTLNVDYLSRDMTTWITIWTDVNGEEHTTLECKIPFFVRPELTECNEPIFINSNTSVAITCRADRIYPATAKCRLNNYSEQNILPSVNYTFEPLNDNTGNFNMRCTIKWNLQPISQQSVIIELSISIVEMIIIPTQLNNMSLELYLPHAELSSDCPKNITSSTSCLCRLTILGSPPGRAFWRSSTGFQPVTVEDTDGSSQLLLAVKTSDLLTEVEYYCSSKSAVGQQKVSYIYKPKYTYFSEDIQVSIVQSNSSCYLTDLRVACSVRGTHIHSRLVAYLYVDNEVQDTFSIAESLVNYTMVHTYKSSSPGVLDIRCEVLNTMGEIVVSKQNRLVNLNIENSCTVENSTKELKIILSVSLTVLILVSALCFFIWRKKCCTFHCTKKATLENADQTGNAIPDILNHPGNGNEGDGAVERVYEELNNTVQNASRISTEMQYMGMDFDRKLHQKVSSKLEKLNTSSDT